MITHSFFSFSRCLLVTPVTLPCSSQLTWWGLVHKYVICITLKIFVSLTVSPARQKEAQLESLLNPHAKPEKKTSHRHAFWKIGSNFASLYLSAESFLFIPFPNVASPHLLVHIIEIFSHTTNNNIYFDGTKANFPIDNIFCMLLIFSLCLLLSCLFLIDMKKSILWMKSHRAVKAEREKRCRGKVLFLVKDKKGRKTLNNR